MEQWFVSNWDHMEQLFVSIWNYIHSNSSSPVIGWLVGGLGSLLAAFLGFRWRRVAESRDAHFSELKEGLLEPMLQYIRERVLPILEHQRGNVGISRKLVPRPASGVMGDDTVYTEAFCVGDYHEAPIDPTLDAPDNGGAWDASERPLYLDGRNHFRKLFQKWDELVTELAQYHVSCIVYASKIRSEIAKASSLPDFRLELVNPSWVYSTNLAVIVLYRQLELDRRPFSRVHENPHDRLTYGVSNTVAQGAPSEVGVVHCGRAIVF